MKVRFRFTFGGVSSFATHLPNASEERQLPPLGINALARLVKILFVQLEADKMPLFLDAGDRRRSTAHAIIQNRVAFVAVGADEVCERAGIKRPTLSAIEGGYYNTGIRQITDVAKALGAHIEVVKD